MMNTKRRIIVLVILVTAIILGVLTYTMVEGKTYTERFENIGLDRSSDNKVSVTLDREDIVEVTDCYVDDEGHPVISFSSLNEGDVTATLVVNGNPYYHFPLRVNYFGTIFSLVGLKFDGYVAVEISVIGCLGLIVLVAAYSFVESVVKSRFSYSMVAFGGVALFCAALITVTVYKMQWMNSFVGFLENSFLTGVLFAIVSAPFVLALCAAIAFSNIWLLRHEGFRPQNMLGIVLGVFWFLALIVMAYVISLLTDGLDYHVSKNILYTVAYLISFMACMLLSTVICSFLASKRRPQYDKDYLIILGCCIRSDGTPTPILKGRIDAAVRFEREQFAATGKHAKFVPSGGQGSDEVISESESMARYLMEQGYPAEQIVKEDKSVNTDQNIRFSRNRIIADAGTADGVKVGIATTNYHIFRSYILADKYGLDAQGISAKTKWYFFPNAFLREFAGLLVAEKWKILIIIGAIVGAMLIGNSLLSMV